MKYPIAGLLLTLASVILASPSLACIDSPIGSKQGFTEGLKEGLIYHDGEFAHLIITASVKALKDGTLPNRLAWTIPLPSLPTEYKRESAGLFRSLRKITGESRSSDFIDGKGGGKGNSESGNSAMTVHSSEQVGEYTVTPIEILKDSSGSELNRWLEKHGFTTVSAEQLKYYLKPGATFLAVEIDGIRAARFQFSPLHIIYKSEKAVFPVKLSSHADTFDLDLWIFCPGSQVPKASPASIANAFLAGEPKFVDRKKSETSAYFAVPSDGYLVYMFGKDINGKGRALADWPEDPYAQCK